MLTEGIEDNIHWYLKKKGRVIEIIVKDEDSDTETNYLYDCNYEPIFGYDFYDVCKVNKILNKMIKKARKVVEKYF